MPQDSELAIFGTLEHMFAIRNNLGDFRENNESFNLTFRLKGVIKERSANELKSNDYASV